MIRHCEHVKANGHFCKSPAMRGRNYCFFHLNLVGQRLRAEQVAARGQHFVPELPALEDAASIQLALMQVNDWLLRDLIDHRRAALLLYSLQTASCNLRNMQKEAEADAGDPVCNRYDSFEQDYELEDCDALRVEETTQQDNVAAKAAEIVEGAKYAGLIKEEASEKRLADRDDPDLGVIEEDDDPVPIDGPINVLDRAHIDSQVRIPLILSPVQYEQAKVAIFGYEALNRIDREHPEGRKPVPQRAAISQKITLGVRKPVSSASAEAGRLQLPAFAIVS